MKYPKRSQYKYAKSPYRIRIWPEYEADLRNRGDLTVWLSDAALHAWRLKKLGDINFRGLATDRPIHLLIDSPGLRIHVGHLRKPPKRRVWRKLHLAVNAETGEVLAAELTNRRTADCPRVPGLLAQIDDRVASVMGPTAPMMRARSTRLFRGKDADIG